MRRSTRLLQRGLFTSLIVLMTAGLPVWAQYAGGGGTANDPYRIETAEQMNAVGLHPEDWDKHFQLAADIDMNDLDGAPVNVIGEFGGVFDGNGHRIANFTYLVKDEDILPGHSHVAEIGLFRMVRGWDALVKDLGMVNPRVEPAPTCTKQVQWAGALVGLLWEGWVRNCYVEGGRVVGSERVGGLVGYCHAYAAVSESWSSADVSGGQDIGGLVGGCMDSVEIWECHARAHVSGSANVGGLIGSCVTECVVDNCFSAGTVTASTRAGGLLGSLQLQGSISNCYSTARVSGSFLEAGGLVARNAGVIRTSWAGGDVTGGRMVGGLVGYSELAGGYSAQHSETLVADCYATGTVHGEDAVGGLIGENEATVRKCYSTGAVTGSGANSRLGGLVARDTFAVPWWDVQDCFWDTAASGISLSDGGSGRNTAEMQSLQLYLAAGWDFTGETFNGAEDLWKMPDDGPGYPKLAWEHAPDPNVSP